MRILLSGYYGFGNTGDEAVLESLLRLFRSLWEEPEFTVLSAAPAETAARHGAAACSRWRPDVLLRELLRADLFVSGGGSLFQDATSRRSLGYYLAQLELARWTDTPRIVAFQGVGPLRRSSSRLAVLAVLQDVSALILRDSDSASLLHALGVLSPPVYVAADPAIMLTPAPEDRGQRLLQQCGLPPDRPIVAVSLREWPTLPKALPTICAALRHVRDRRNLSLLLLPLHARVDRDVCRRVQEEVGDPCSLWEGDLSPTDCVTLLAQCELVLGMRLHSLIFAVAAGTPTVGLSYDPKVTAFLSQSRQPCAGEVGALRREEMQQTIETALDHRADLAAAARAARDRLRQQVSQAGRWLVEQLPSR